VNASDELIIVGPLSWFDERGDDDHCRISVAEPAFRWQHDWVTVE
jgi:hypothetical protein